MDKQLDDLNVSTQGRNAVHPLRLSSLMTGINTAIKSSKWGLTPAQNNTFAIEQLEPRLLLSADPLATLVAGANDVTLQVIENAANEQYIQLINNQDNGAVLAERKIDSVGAASVITVTGTDEDDTFTVDQSFLELGESNFLVQFDGGDGSDTVAVGSTVTTSNWQINGDNEGNLGDNGSVEFLNTENIEATKSDDSIHVLAAVNNSYNWQIDAEGDGVISTLQDELGGILDSASSTSITFKGFDELGGSGSDYLDYSDYSQGVTIDLENEQVTGFDSVTGMNTLIGSDYADSFVGDSNNNIFVVGFGDSVDGSGGYDTVLFKESGSAGIDLSVQLDSENAEIDYVYQGGSWDGATFTDTLDHTVTIFDVALLAAEGGSGDNYFDFSQSELEVHLMGGAGADTLLGGSAADVFVGGAGNDSIDGGDGTDEVITVRAANVVIDGNTIKVSDDEVDTLTDVETIYVKALSNDDDITGYTLDARLAGDYDITLEGTELADTLYASAYGDTLIGLEGADTLTAGAGVDTVDESFSGRASITVENGNYALDLSHGANEIIALSLPAITSGSGYTLTIEVNSNTLVTDEITWDAGARDVSRAIEKALDLAYGQLIVTEQSDGWSIEFSGLYSGQPFIDSITASNNATATISQVGTQVLDTLIAFDSSDYIELEGSVSADDVDLHEFLGNSTISTLAGSDTIRGAQGSNIIDAGDGNDFVTITGESNDTVIGGEGEDTLTADMSDNIGTAHSFDLDNDRLMTDLATITLLGFESAEMIGADGNDTFDATDFSGLSETTNINLLDGWADLSEFSLLFTLDDDSAVVEVDTQTAQTLEELLAMINVADDRETGALFASFDQGTTQLTITGISGVSVSGDDNSILRVLGLDGVSVANNMVTGVSLGLMASLQLTTQRGNAGADSFIGSQGMDLFVIDDDDSKVQGLGGDDSLSTTTTLTHTQVDIFDDALVWKGAAQTDKSVALEDIEHVTVVATSGATVIDASSATIDATLDASDTSAALTGGLGVNEFRLDVGSRVDVVSVTVSDLALSNDVVFYGGSDVFSVSDFALADINGDNFTFVSESSGDLTIDSNVFIAGQSVKFDAGGTITVSADVSTDDQSDSAGDIGFYARHIKIDDGVSISAKGLAVGQNGDINIIASDSRNKIKGVGFYNFDDVSASVTIGAATIEGRDVTLVAFAETNPDSPVNYGGDSLESDELSIKDFKAELENFALFFGYSRSQVDTTVTIDEDAVIKGDNVTIESHSIARVKSEPLAVLFSVAIGSIRSDANVEMNGTVIAEGDVVITSKVENYMKVAAEPYYGFKGFAASVAVGILESDSTTLVSDTAQIIGEGDLDVSAYTSDFTYVGALSDAGAKGKLAASVAVHIEHGDTNATLAGDIIIAGDVDVTAEHKQGRVDGVWGTEVEAIVDRVPSILDNFKDKYKQKAANVAAKTILPNFITKRISPSDRLKPTKFTLGIAFGYADDTNNANALIGLADKSSDIQIGGSLEQTAQVESRQLTSVSSTSSTVSQMSQLSGSTGTKSEFNQVPFGGAVSVMIADMDNNASALVQGNTQLDVLDKITLDAQTENLTGLISPDTTFKYVKPDYIQPSDIDTDYLVNPNDLIGFHYKDYDWQQSSESEQPDIGYLGAVYKYIGDEQQTLRFSTTDFSDVTQWELLGDKVTSLPSQLLGGDSDLYLIDNTVKSEAAGAKVSIGLNFGYLNVSQNANAKVLGGAQINQRTQLENNFDEITEAAYHDLVDSFLGGLSSAGRDISVTSNTTNQQVDYVGLLTATNSNIPILKTIYEKSGQSESLNGAGVSVYINTVTLNSQAIIEDGAMVYADDLTLDADSNVFAINLGYSAGYGKGTLGLSGLFINNIVDTNTQARIESGVDLLVGTRISNVGDVERLTVTADNRVDIITIAGGGASGGAVGVGASSIVNIVTKVTKAEIGTQDAASRSGDIDVNGDVKVAASSDGFIIGSAISAAWATGKVAPSGGDTPKTNNSSYGISVSGAFIFNIVDHTTSASIYNLNSFNAEALTLEAVDNSGVFAFPIAYSSSEAQKFALAAAGIGLRNDVDVNIDAGISGVNNLTLGNLSINATNNTTVVSASVSAALSGVADTPESSNTTSIAITGNVSVNNVINDVDAFLVDIDSATISGKDSDNLAVDIEAKDSSEIYAVALGVAYAGNGSVAVTYSENNIDSDIDALISNVDMDVTIGKVRHQANSEADILSVAIGAGVSKDTSPNYDTKVGLSVAAAVSYNTVRMNTRAKVLDSTITLPSEDLDTSIMEVKAHNETDIIGVVVAPSIGLQSGSETTITLSGSGASVENEVYGDTIAQVDGSTIDQLTTTNDPSSADTGLYVSADADGDISATVISASIAWAGATTGTGVSGGIGVALAQNRIGDDSGSANAISATITDSSVDIAGAVETYAESKQEITAAVVAASVALANSNDGVAGALSGVGASTENSVMIDTTSGITAVEADHVIKAGSISVEAKDTSSITSAVVGASIAGTFSASSGAVSLSIGVALAENDIDNDTVALIDNVDIGASDDRAGSVSVIATSNATITATSVATSFALGWGSGTISATGAGANAINAIAGSTKASIANSQIYSSGDISINASNTSKVNAEIAAVSVAGAVGTDGGLGVSIGAAETENNIGSSGNRLSVIASVIDSDIDTSGNITITSTADLDIDAGVGAGSMAIAAGGSGVGVAASGTGVSALNEIYANVDAYIDNSSAANQTIKGASLTLNASNVSDIDADAAAASVAAGFASGGAAAVTIGVALARNEIDNNTRAYVAGADVDLGTGALDIDASTDNTIDSLSVAASLGVAFGSSGGLSISGAGANSINSIHGETLTYLDGVDVENAGAVTLDAENTSDISATVASVSVAGGGGSGGGIGVSIGASVSENEIGTSGDRLSIASYIQDSSVNASGDLSLTASGDMTIFAGVGAGGMAVAGGSGGGLAGAGSGVSATNDVYAAVASYIDNLNAASATISANSISISATSESTITAELGSASLGIAAGAGGAGTLTIGISIADNTIDVNTSSYLLNAGSVDSSGAISVSSSTTNDIDATSVAATASFAAGAGGAVSISGAGAEAVNSINGETLAYIEGSQIDSASQVSLTASDTSDIDATVAAVAVSAAAGASGGVGVAIGAALASNNIGNSGSRQAVRSYVKNSGITTTGALNLDADGNMTVFSGVGAGSMAISGGAGGGVSGAGAGVSTVNDIYTDVETYIDNSSASSKIISSSSVDLDADNTSKITADAGAASLAAAFGAGGGVSLSVGVALAENTVDANTSSYITDVGELSSGDISVTATTDNTIDATAVAASIAAAGGVGGGVAISGAGAETVNYIYGETQAYIANSALGESADSTVGNVDVKADNTSKINSTVAAVSVAGAGGAGGGLGVSLGGSVAVNEIGADSDRIVVTSYVDNSELYASGALEIDSTLDMTINSGVGSGSAAVVGGAGGAAISGAAVRVENEVYADLDSYIQDSTQVTATDISVTSSSTSDIDATAAAATIAGAFAPAGIAISIGASRVVNIVDVDLNSDIDNSNLQGSGDFTLTAKTTDDVFTTGVAASVSLGLGFSGAGVFVESDVTGDIGVSMTDSDIEAAGDGTVKAIASAEQTSEAYGISAGFISAGVVFADSNTDIDTLVTQSNTDYQGGDLSIVAKATENNYVLAVAGSGGVLAGAGVGADTTSTSNTQVTVDDESSIILGEESGDGILDIKAEHIAQFDAKVVVASGGLLSGSGAEIDHDVTADVTVTLGDGASNSDNLLITASDINVDAINRAEKNQDGRIDVVAVGLASAAGADSRTVLDMATTIDVGDDASLTAWGSGDSDGIALNALNDLDITDKVVLNATGALAGTGATVKISDDELLAKVRIGQNAILESEGDVQISARGQGTAVGNVEADSSGAISVSVTNSTVNITPVNTVLIDMGADITAYGDMNISAGTDTDFNRDDYKVHALIDSFSDSVIPVDDAGAYATLSQTNSITVASGAHVKTARQMNLHAERFGYADMDAQTKTVNWASALGGTADLGGEVTIGTTGTVNNAGTLETGIGRNQSIEFISLNDDGTVDEVTQTDGISFSTSIEALSSSLFEDLEYAEEQLSIFNDGEDSDTDIEAFYKSEITRLQAELLDKGLMDVSASGDYFAVSLSTSVITIDDIHAEAGRIDIRSGEFEDTGSVLSPGDASVSILNHTLASLVVNDITIPQENGGVYLNGERQDTGVDDEPLISIINDVDLDLAQAELAISLPDNNAILTWPSITLNGEVTNRSGSLELKSLSGEDSTTLGKGDINIYADIDVKEQVIMTGGSTVISLPPGSVYSVDGSEYAKWNEEIGDDGLSEASDSEIDDLVGREITGPSIYADNISITAEYININGKIQSGKESFTLEIDESLEDTIDGLRADGATGLIRLDVDSEDFSVFYDATNDQIVVGDMRVSGGYIELEGHILNTNTNSEIELLGGYADIDVVNSTDLDVKILGLDASQRGQGTLIIRDKAKGTSDNPLETTYIKDENGVTVTTNGVETSGSDDMTYDPKTGWRYSWTMGQEQFERRYTTEATSSWLGIDAFAKDPDDVVFDGDPEPLGPATLRGEGAYFEYVPSDSDDDYTFDTNHIELSSETSLVRKWTKSTWWGKKTYYAKFVNESKVRDESTHSIKADYGVAITFTGKEAGSIDIVSNQGGDVIVQGAISNTQGTTTITTNADIYTQSTGSVGGNNIELIASNIGGVAQTNVDGSIDASITALNTNLNNDGNGGITARTYGGRINIVETDGPLVVNNITSASSYGLATDTGGQVYLSAVGGVEGQSGETGLVRGGTILINSEAHVGTSSQALVIDSGELNTDSVSVIAINDIYLTELDGNFLAKEISSSSGDVSITVSQGSLVDANNTTARDERTYEELSTGLWQNLGLIEGSDTAQDKIDNVIDAYVTAREMEYSTYWNIRNGQFDGVYTADEEVALSADEEEYYREVYETIGLEDGLTDVELETFVDDAIQTLVNKRTAEYHALHASYGADDYDSEYEYQLSDEQRAELTGSVHVWTEDELTNLISGSLLKPITNTQASIEDANISAGGNITIITKDDIGSAVGSVEIDLDGDYSDDERVQLAAAERNDVYFLLSERAQSVEVDVVESDSGDSLVRESGSWIADGFVAGMQIRIAGDSGNANDEGSFYEIAAVTADTMTLTSTALSVEVAVIMDVAAISSTPDLSTLINTQDQTWESLGLVQDSFVSIGSEVYQVNRIAAMVIDLEEVDPSIASSIIALNAADYRMASVTKIVIDQREDIDVLVTGTISATASGNVYLGSEQSMMIDSISGDNVRIKSKQSLTDETGTVASVSATSTLILEAGSGAIGSASNRFNIDLADDATLTARAQQDIYITEINSDLNIATIYSSGGTVDLQALNGSILDSFDHEYENIRAQDIVLTADAGSIGVLGNLLDINLTGGVLNASALNDIRLNETDGNLDVDHVESTQGDVELIAHLAILDGVVDEASEIADVVGASISLTARFDTVGQVGNDLEVDSGSTEGENLTVSSANNTHLTETRGDLYLNSIETGIAAIAFIAAPAGRILNDNASGDNVVAGKTYLFASLDIGSADKALSTQVGNIQGQSTTGSTYIENTGALSVGGVVDGISNGFAAGGEINMITRSPLTVEQSMLAGEDINLTSTDNSDNDDITIASGVTLETSANININSGDGFTLQSGAVLDADLNINIQVDDGDTGNQDLSGATIDLQGSMTAAGDININGADDQDSLIIQGMLQAENIVVNMGADNDSVLVDTQTLVGDTFINLGSGDDAITINQLNTREDQLVLDGEGGTDSYIINRSGTDKDYVIDVQDSGAANDGADVLTLNGLASDDTFLIRANFVAAINDDGNGGYSDAVERINYDGNINARLIINGLDGEDSFYSDDTGTIVTLDGGAGNDTFQVGQLFGSDRQASLGMVAAGDEIETTETTLGFLSNGNSLPMVIYGGDGEDSIKVYSNQAVTKLYGEAGDDSFVVRAFLLADSGLTNSSVDVELFGGDGADTIEYSINAALKIDGGAGSDKVVVLGTEGDDSFMITEDGIFGAGLNISYQGVEFAELDGLEGDDTFYVLSTNADVETTIIGGLGADVFNVASDVTQSIVSYSVEGRSSFINHSVFSDDDAYNGIFVDGVSLNVASEENGAIAISNQSLLVDEDGMTDSYELSLSVDEPNVATLAYVTVSAARASTSDKDNSNGQASSVLVSIDNINFYESLVVTYQSGVNWQDSTQIFVKAIDDSAMEGESEYVISHSVSSDNPDFDNLDIANVEVRVFDNDQADIILMAQGDEQVTEGGTAAQFDVRLSTQPEIGEVVTVSLAELIGSGLSGQLSLSDSELTFDHSNWDQVQSFSVTAVDDADVENLYQGSVQLSATSNVADSDYNQLDDVEQILFVTDNDSGAVIVTQTDGSTLVSQNQDDDYSLVLSKAPTDAVTINLLNDGQTLFSSEDPRFNADDNTVTFDADNWNQPITITLSVNDEYQEQDAQPVQNPPLQPHTLTGIQGKLIIEGGVPEGKARALSVAIMLPTEIDTELPINNIEVSEVLQTDVLNIFNDGSLENDSGVLSDTSLTGLGMGVGIEYADVEVVELFLGQGDDNLVVEDTAAEVITVVHGGGGSDTLSVTGSDEDGVLILFGDTGQNGFAYNATSDEKTDSAREFTNPGNDVIDASGAGGTVTLFGGAGNDTIIGSEYGDHIAGGSGNDQIFGLGGDDHIYGDAGFNIDVSTRLDLSTQILSVVNIADLENDNLDTSDVLTVGNDSIDAGIGDDIVIADKGVINQVVDTNRILSTSFADVTEVTNSGFVNGGSDTLVGNGGNDILLGGNGSDYLYGGNGPEGSAITGDDQDIILGDMGSVQVDTGIVTFINTSDTEQGSNDVIYGDADDDIILAGAGNDYVESGSGNDWVLGDFGEVDLRNSAIILKTEQGDENASGNDEIHLGTGNDSVLGGLGNDTITSLLGNTHLIADNGTLTYDVNSDDSWTLVNATSLDSTLGGNDTVSLGDGDNLVIGGKGQDTITTGSGRDTVIGDNGQVDLIDGVIRTIQSSDTDNTTAGGDTIKVGAGDDRVIAGLDSYIEEYFETVDGIGMSISFVSDTVQSDSGNTQVLADNGILTYNEHGILIHAISTETNIGGDDEVTLGEGDNLIIGGFGSDTLLTAGGNDLIFGDNAQVSFDDAGVLIQAESIALAQGGGDRIDAGDGDNSVIAGFGDDDVMTGSGADVVIGDNGQLDLIDGVIRVLQSTDTDNATAGSDTIQVGTGFDRVIAGLGSDSVQSDSGDTHVLADNGILTYNAQGILTQALSTQPNLGGDDEVIAGLGDNLVIGGFGADTILTSNGADTLVGDNGQLNFDNAGVLLQAKSIQLSLGGDDVINAGNGHNLVIAGIGDDEVTTGSGADAVIGDNGQLDVVNGVIRVMQSLDRDESTTGSDTINLGSGNDSVISGLGSDSVVSDSGNTQVLADNGQLIYNAAGILTLARTTEQERGGDDTVSLGEGDNLVIGGNGSDVINTANGVDVIIGDNGQFIFDDQGVLIQGKTTAIEQGGSDTINAGNGVNLVLGGYANDHITTGDDNDIVIGDNGEVDYVDGVRRLIATTDTSNETGGGDVITLGGGEDHAIAGVGNDEVFNASGETIIIGDDGYITNDSDGRYITVATGNTGIGGADLLVGGDDRDIIFGGYGADEINGGAGDDMLGGDGSRVSRAEDGTIIFEAIDLFVGGNDTLIGGAGQDRMQGHFGNDFFDANFSEDVLIGEYGRFTFVEVDGESVPESIISLANGQLDLIRALQMGLFSGYSADVYEKSAYREISKQRVTQQSDEVIAFTEEAELAFAQMGTAFLPTGSGGATAPVAPVNGADTAPEQAPQEAVPQAIPQEAAPQQPVTEKTNPEQDVAKQVVEAEIATEQRVPQQDQLEHGQHAHASINIEAAVASVAGAASWMVAKSNGKNGTKNNDAKWVKGVRRG
ncbi:LEPR-XLL domain-containing protein [Vibrio rarus]|uniref:LEPR-XLL domain-containing protein n=1 Tax=Vibrio rarus TaxID=413403 RepID=UPI0021C4886B|nr:LEPR-XLL domain-containing protein [Vibrio rarus]